MKIFGLLAFCLGLFCSHWLSNVSLDFNLIQKREICFKFYFLIDQLKGRILKWMSSNWYALNIFLWRKISQLKSNSPQIATFPMILSILLTTKAAHKFHHFPFFSTSNTSKVRWKVNLRIINWEIYHWDLSMLGGRNAREIVFNFLWAKKIFK